MRILLRILPVLPGLVMLAGGVRWIFQPEAAAKSLGMELLEGAGASTQIGDMTSFFLVNGLLVFLGITRGPVQILYVPAAFLGAAACFRSLAALNGYADWAMPAIVFEIVSVGILVVAARRLAQK